LAPARVVARPPDDAPDAPAHTAAQREGTAEDALHDMPPHAIARRLDAALLALVQDAAHHPASASGALCVMPPKTVVRFQDEMLNLPAPAAPEAASLGAGAHRSSIGRRGATAERRTDCHPSGSAEALRALPPHVWRRLQRAERMQGARRGCDSRRRCAPIIPISTR
jgi:hypothetical protein